jgi:hypothetical protein
VVYGLWFVVCGSWFRVPGFGGQGSGPLNPEPFAAAGDLVSGSELWGSGFREYLHLPRTCSERLQILLDPDLGSWLRVEG